MSESRSKFDELFNEYEEAVERAQQYGTLAHNFYAQGRWEAIINYVHWLEANLPVDKIESYDKMNATSTEKDKE